MIVSEIAKRRSIRDYSSRPIEKRKLERILEAGQLAPTARNKQDWRIIVIDDEGIKNRLIDAASPHQPFLRKAPIILVACALDPNYVMRCGHPAFLIDLAIVLDHISLQAVREGLGTCWIGSFDEAQARSVLKIPPTVRVVELMSVGYGATIVAPRPRKTQNDLFRWNKW